MIGNYQSDKSLWSVSVYNLAQNDKNNEKFKIFKDYKNRYYPKQILQNWKCQVINDQKTRKFIYNTTKNQSKMSWDYHPFNDSNISRDRYMRNHKDLNVLEEQQRYPQNVQRTSNNFKNYNL